MRQLTLPLLLLLVAAPTWAQQHVAVGGVSMTLPPSWKGTAQSDESRAPTRTSYAFNNLNARSELDGARIAVYRVTGLNPLERNDWWRGRLAFATTGSRPVAAISPAERVFDNATGYRTESDGRTGTIYLTQREGTFYAIHLSTSSDAFEDQLPSLLEIARTIRFL